MMRSKPLTGHRGIHSWLKEINLESPWDTQLAERKKFRITVRGIHSWPKEINLESPWDTQLTERKKFRITVGYTADRKKEI
jgi:hypothetical protein